ncbi:MAG: plasmid recombination protein [Parvibaculum sp.]|nr:plasmid recombination protein [Parvibaculum sp.]
MAFQFLHVDIVARAVPKKATAKRWALRDVLAEAGRVTAACPHIDAPRPPKRLFGLALPEVERVAERQAEEARDAKGRRLRKDAPVMLAGVLSYPVALADMDERSRADYEAWEASSLRWLAGGFGDTLAAVVRHEDEAYPHIHFFIVPHLTSGKALDLEAVHPGIAAREDAKRDGKSTKEANRAYCEAMRHLQDDFHAHVGVFHGHLREGPRRRRLSRGAYLAEKRDAERRAETMNKAESRLTELEAFKLAAAGADKVQHRAQLLEREVVELREENRTLKRERADFGPRLEAAEGKAEKHRFDASRTAKAFALLVGLVTTGRDRFRVALVTMSRPLQVDDGVWQRLRRYLTGEDDDDGMPFERRRQGYERE